MCLLSTALDTHADLIQIPKQSLSVTEPLSPHSSRHCTGGWFLLRTMLLEMG